MARETLLVFDESKAGKAYSICSEESEEGFELQFFAKGSVQTLVVGVRFPGVSGKEFAAAGNLSKISSKVLVGSEIFGKQEMLQTNILHIAEARPVMFDEYQKFQDAQDESLPNVESAKRVVKAMVALTLAILFCGLDVYVEEVGKGLMRVLAERDLVPVDFGKDAS